MNCLGGSPVGAIEPQDRGSAAAFVMLIVGPCNGQQKRPNSNEYGT